MKFKNTAFLFSPLLFSPLLPSASAQSVVPGFQNIVRMIEPGSAGNGPIIWDLPGDVPANGQDVLIDQPVPENGAVFILRTIEASPFQDWFLDSTAVGAYLPLADIRVSTHDTESFIPRTRADQPIEVSATVSGLFPGQGVPDVISGLLPGNGSENGNGVQRAAREVRLQRFTQAYAPGEISLPNGEITTEAYGELSLVGNGEFPRQNEQLNFFSNLNPERPEKARGEEHFVIRSLADANVESEALDQVAVEVWPVWESSQTGLESPAFLPYNFSGVEDEKTALEMGAIEPDENFQSREGEISYDATPPNMTFSWRDLYPSSTVGIIVNDARIPHPWGGRWVGGTKRVFNENASFDYEITVSDWGDIFAGPGRYGIWVVTHTPGIGWEVGGNFDADGNVVEGGWIVPIRRPSIEVNGSIHSLSE